MASGSRAGRGSRAPAPRAAADPADGVPGARFADLPAADLVGLLARSNRRASDFVDVALVLAARERRLADAEARARAADKAAARERAAAEAEIREWRRRAVEAEARLLRVHQAGGGGRDGHRVVPSRPTALKKRMLRAWESEGAHAAVDEDDEAAWEEDRDALAIVPHGQGYYNLPEASFGNSRDVVGEQTTRTEERKHGGDHADMSVEGDRHGSDCYYHVVAHESDDPLGHLGVGQDGIGHENPVALAVVAPGHELRQNEDDVVEGVEAAGRQQSDEPEASEKSRVTTATARRPPPIKTGMLYKMVFKALKEKERQATPAKPAAAASQPSLRCWLYAPLPTEPVAKAKEKEEGPGDMDEDAPEQ